MTGLCRITTYEERRRNEDFAARWDEAVELGTSALEDEAVRRAMAGVQKSVYYQGEVCGEVTEYSDTLLAMMLKARRRDVFGDKAIFDHKVSMGFIQVPPKAL